MSKKKNKKKKNKNKKTTKNLNSSQIKTTETIENKKTKNSIENSNEKKQKETNGNLDNTYFNILKDSALFLLIAITSVLVITNLLFVCKCTITKFHLPIIYILCSIGYVLFKRKNWKKTIVAIVIGTAVFSLFTVNAGKIYDSTSDGNTYHKLAVGALKNGWNPIYDDVAKFNKNQGNPFDILEDNVNVKWVNHYANGTELFGAVVYAFTGNIETAKVFNMLWIYIGLFILIALFKQMNLTLWKSVLLSFILAFNPIIITHIGNLYLDGVLAISLFIIILTEIIRSLYEKNPNKENNIILAMAIIWCINAKFNGLGFAAVFCFVLYLYRNINNFIKNKEQFTTKLIKETLYYIIVVFIAIVIVGSSTYTKNLITHGHPFYPLYGKGHVDNMVMMEIPKSMQEYSSLRIFLTSMFAKSENVSPSYAEQVNEPDLKIPFTTSSEEISNFNIPDIRMGGFGPLFSGIFVITIIGLTLILIELIKKKNYEKIAVYGIVVLTTIILVLTLDGSYWARYIPYVYLLPIYMLIHLFKKDFKESKYLNIIGIIIIGILIINSSLIFKTQINNIKSTNKYITIRIDRLKTYYEKNKSVEIRLNHHGLQGVQYNLDDLNIKKYKLKDDEKLENEGYMFCY